MSESLEPLPPQFTRFRNRALSTAIVALVICVLVAWLSRSSRQQFMTSYLFAYLFCLGLALGSLAIVMLHHLVGGNWGAAVHGPAEAATTTLPLLAILFIPIAYRPHYLYDWADRAKVAADPILRHRDAYMQFAAARAAGCFIVWILLALALQLN